MERLAVILPRRADAAFLLALLPAGLLAVNSRWIWSGVERDPWIYYGYFRFARIYLHDFDTLYFSSRLSVILPGYLARHLLPAVPANLALHLALYWTALFALWGVLRSLYGHTTALLTVTACGVHPAFLLSIGRNLVDGFGLTYALLGLCFLTLAAQGRAWRAWQFLAGGAVAALVVANLFFGLSGAFLVAYFVGLGMACRRRPILRSAGGRQPILRSAGGRRPLWRSAGWRRLVGRSAAWFALGGGAALGTLALVGHFWGGGRLLFLAATVEFLRDFLAHPSIFKRPYSAWLGGAVWLVFPALVLGGAVAMLWHGRGSPSPLRFVQVLYCAFFAAMLAVQLTQHGVTLQFDYYASMLLPFAFIALGGQLAPVVAELPARRVWGLALAIAVLGIAAAFTASWSGGFAAGSSLALLVPLCLGLGLVVVPAAGRRGLLPALFLLGSLALSQAVVAQRALAPRGGPWTDQAGTFLQLDRSLSALRDLDPSLHLRLWYDDREPAWKFFDTLASTVMLCPRLLTTHFPDAAGGRTCDGQQLGPGVKVAVLSARPEAGDLASAALRAIGLGCRRLGERSIPGPATFHMTFLETEALP
jgi:hypothetical protein